jgi:hypothetical protein
MERWKAYFQRFARPPFRSAAFVVRRLHFHPVLDEPYQPSAPFDRSRQPLNVALYLRNL